MMLDFAKTPMGRKFFERTIPAFLKALVDLARVVDDNTQSTERNTAATEASTRASPRQRPPLNEQELLAKMQPALDKMKAQGITVDQEVIDKLRKEVLRETAVKILNHGKVPDGYKPIVLDESDITSAPADAKRRALFLALDNWIKTDPTERAEVVEQLRSHGDASARRAATILALFVQFEDTLRDALLDEKEEA